jgi:hypothetical protein
MADPKPFCGQQTQSSKSILDTILGVFTIVSSAWGVYTAASSIVKAGMDAASVFTVFGISFSAYAVSALIGAAITVLVVIVFVIDRCGSKGGAAGCAAGVIERMIPSFASASDYLFPFTAMHDRADVVVKSSYWHVVANNAQFVDCGPDSQTSPLLHCFYKSDEVCRAGAAAIAGAIIGAVVGVIAGAAIGAAIGCATIILCIIALLVALIVAVVCVLIIAAVSAWLALAAGPNTSPTSSGGSTLKVGDYVTAKGNLIVHSSMDGAIAEWFTTDTTLHGSSMSGEGPGGSAPFPFTDPDTNLVPDAC